MNEKATALARRTKQYALDIIRFSTTLPNRREFNIICRQWIRSGTSVGANYRAACRAKSRADFIAKMSIVEEETDESLYWIELLTELGYRDDAELTRLHNEGSQLLAIVVQSKKTARGNA
jgi:four helix bundle protein